MSLLFLDVFILKVLKPPLLMYINYYVKKKNWLKLNYILLHNIINVYILKCLCFGNIISYLI